MWQSPARQLDQAQLKNVYQVVQLVVAKEFQLLHSQGCHQRHAGHPFGRKTGELHGHGAAHGKRHQVCLLDFEFVQELQQVDPVGPRAVVG